MNSICSISDCASPVKARGWCGKHYNRWSRHGDPLGGRTPNGVPMAFLEATVANPPNECVIWPFNTNGKGYGQVKVDGRMQPAHRVALELFTGEQHPGLEAAHLPIECHNRSCINPRHLKWATKQENQADRLLDDTHNRGERHVNSKLTKTQVLEIRDAHGLQREIADDFGISRKTVSKIKRRETWTHL